ncbi:DUF106 domain-containing protein [Candidatus Woesearchaeota archaeon]|nr:DUF106 domain-containing protein [Candidatus Woesearchaeota archaeon]
MGIFSFLNPALDAVFGPLLNLSYFWAIMILSLIISVVISLIYKYTTNQSLMKDLKTEIKDLQKEMKQLKNEPKKMMEIQKKAMETNMKYMMHSMRPMLFTFIPIIIIFGWMTAHFAYEPILPGEEFTTTMVFENGEGNATLVVPEGVEMISEPTKKIENGEVKWKLTGEEGSYLLEYQHDGKAYTKEVLITNEKDYAEPIKTVKEGDVKAITVNNSPVKILNLYIKGWKLGWIGTYIVFSIIFSMLVRKWLKIY